MAGRAKVPEELERLTKSQRLTVIDEAALGFENTVIARRTLIATTRRQTLPLKSGTTGPLFRGAPGIFLHA